MSLTEPFRFEDLCEARREHAWLLRAEGLKYSEIGRRLGVTDQQAANMVAKFGRRVQAAINRPRTKQIFAFHAQQWAIARQRGELQAEAARWIEAWVAP